MLKGGGVVASLCQELGRQIQSSNIPLEPFDLLELPLGDALPLLVLFDLLSERVVQGREILGFDCFDCVTRLLVILIIFSFARRLEVSELDFTHAIVGFEV